MTFSILVDAMDSDEDDEVQPSEVSKHIIP